MKCRTLRPETGDDLIPAGTVIDHPEAFILVEIGKAKPADEECLARVKARGRLNPRSWLLENLTLVKDEEVDAAPATKKQAKAAAPVEAKASEPAVEATSTSVEAPKA